MKEILPKVKPFNEKEFYETDGSRLFICSEGFETRSLFFLQNVKDSEIFTDALICTYVPERKSRLNELLPLIENKCENKPEIITFNRFEPFVFEELLHEKFVNIQKYNELVIDISVMSKLLILIIFTAIRTFNGKLRVVYSEPDQYKPSKDEYLKNKDEFSKSLALPSFGIHDVIRTPMLSSIIMQRSPSLIVSFLSFNEQLIKALLSNINPTYLYLVNGVPPILKWRERAMVEIHHSIISEYSNDNELDCDGLLKRRTSTLDYSETFDLLASIYRQYCINRRIIIAPTGSKMQALACALIKNICSDIHIEYPTPESYFIEGYSGSKNIKLHEVEFNNYSDEMALIGDIYQLNS